ncbi:LysE family transporter [Agrobacterium vitis]|uniref:LysE family translocator n=1 Tax=Agrobacterium vitis TaxID=373 RepID=A0A368NZH5_AGRVI|nr:LysE family transporter [Agrobacterium vitis]KAA3514837.1 LysE family translocator [Agrobacterium vitis]KAA3528367.1 LysE family translocator [Agrobacterium vitis]MCF1477816.1 LysE family translocator [Agrobacterium vitis]MUZ97783.1 LysE family translocator [Agrobacterium vitis]MVA31039.1 LysE family translocator [Agrobacterium vitis]
MTMVATLFAIAFALLIGAASPGPSFLLVSHTSMTRSRAAGLVMALGMGTGGLIFASLALVGLAALITQLAWLHKVLQVAGGLYLAYIAWKLWRGAAQPVDLEQTASAPKSFSRIYLSAFLTQISNPKTAIVYASIFAALLPPRPDSLFFIMLPAVVFLVEAGWYALVALVFSAPIPRRAYLAARKPLDRCAALVLGGLGLRLVFEGARP